MPHGAVRLAALLAALVLSCAPAQGQDSSGDFDFYVLALSWSPTWCAIAAQAAESPQCEPDADFGFIVHGLWPQFERGYPEFCAEGENAILPHARSVADIMPDPALAEHAWRKHGTCTGLLPQDYLTAVRAAFERVAIPPEFRDAAEDRTLSAAAIEAAFVRANPGLSAAGVAVSCEDGRFEEVRICLTRDLAFRSCAEVDARGCRKRSLDVPAP